METYLRQYSMLQQRHTPEIIITIMGQAGRSHVSFLYFVTHTCVTKI